MAVTEGQLISDGTAVWKVKRIDSVEVPVGFTAEWPADTIPAGWLLCDGSAVSRTLYAKLFAVIGTKWGEGDGSTTFNLPNSIGRFAEGSATSGSYKSAGLPNIRGSFAALSSPQTYLGYQIQNVEGACTVGTLVSNCSSLLTNTFANTNGYAGVIINASRSSTVYGNSTTVQPASYTVRKIIKY